MEYITKNNFNYINLTDTPTVAYNGSTCEVINNVEYLNQSCKDIVFISNNISLYYKTVSTTSQTLLECKALNSRPCNKLMYLLSMSFTTSDFTAIKDTDTITFTFKVNNSTYTSTKKVEKLFMNTYNFFEVIDINGTISSFTVSATSTTPLSYFDVKNTHQNHIPANCFILM